MKFTNVLTLVALGLATAAFAKSDHSYPMDVPLSSEQTVNFNVEEGEFNVRGDPTVTSIHMEVSIDRFFIFRLGEKDILQKLIKVTRSGSEVTIATDIPRSIANWGRAEYPIDFKVVVPAKMNVNLRDSSGIIEISDVEGLVNVDDKSGTVKASRLGGGLTLRKDSGDVLVSDVSGETLINNRSGQMRFERVGVLNIPVSEGNLYIADAASSDIHNRSGNITVMRVKGRLTLQDTSGEIVVSDIDGEVTISDDSGQIRAKRTGALTIRDTDGNITVEDAPSLRVTEKASGEVKVRNVSGAVEIPKGIKVKRQ